MESKQNKQGFRQLERLNVKNEKKKRFYTQIRECAFLFSQWMAKYAKVDWKKTLELFVRIFYGVYGCLYNK